MGRQSTRRVNRRQRKMAGLAATNPRGFIEAWLQLLDIRIGEIFDGVNRERIDEIAEMILSELNSYGQHAVTIAHDLTACRLRETSRTVCHTPKVLYSTNGWSRVARDTELFGVKSRI